MEPDIQNKESNKLSDFRSHFHYELIKMLMFFFLSFSIDDTVRRKGGMKHGGDDCRDLRKVKTITQFNTHE